ncbi:Flagellar hook-length control protein-like protein [Alkalidesulfovibrio alkalitolerans DSM 16529]|uniref:Flagellar hook-length control protein-like protein n=1 Tax=Alkalidesulfovibrio alkalitolerans DSM 16529 TaxID=1121439 RepID=S7T8L2_9BACT|nr:flagellar hook-length control protein FliK [Alkalidesulfovibrio alkalitolerans]EPR32936.1 Flagellar hook-length control protein-like protein [Alkalidesulfovibrio alkalitolerans DSM 16529]
MQILPDTSKQTDLLFGFGASETQKTAASFASILNDAASDGREAAARIMGQGENAARQGLAEGENARRNAGSVDTQSFRRIEKEQGDPREVALTPMDFARVRESLQKYGLAKADIDELEDRVNSKGGLTWGQLVSTLMQKTHELGEGKISNPLTAPQKQELDLFFQKIGFSPDESKGLLKDLEQGRFRDVLAVLQKKLDSLPPDRLLDLSPKGVHALAEAMKAPAELRDRLVSLLGSGERETFGISEIKNALSQLQSEDAARLAARRDALAELQKDLTTILRDARERATGADGGAADEARKKIISKDKDETLVERFLGKDAKDDQKVVGEAGRGRDGEQAGRERDPRDSSENLRDPRDTREANARASKDDPSGWKTFFERLDERGGEMRQATVRFMEQAQLRAQDAAPKSENTAAKYSDRAIFDQIDKGLFKNLQNGASRLTLQLEPENLGQVHLTLQVQGKEVRALIRTEHQDVTRVLAEQLAQVRESLEQQGLRVTELEVKTGLSDNSLEGRQWTSTEQHNMEQQRQLMADLRNRMRVLREVIGDTSMSRDQTGQSVAALLGENGLYVVA